jgi:predicted TIM-barrel fold metal-dependent hydrolase
MAIELDIPIYFHHSHMFGPSKYCPLKYARIYILDELTIDFPELRFNVEHMGYPWTEELLSIMARSPNVFTDIAMYLSPDPVMRGRPLMLARNLAMARDYNVLDRVFYGSDYDFDENIDGYAKHVTHEVTYLRERLPHDMEKLGYEPLSQDELDGLLRGNVLKLWNRPT